MSLQKQETSTSIGLTHAFHRFQDGFNEESEIRENIRTIVRELEDQIRSIINVVQVVHHQDGLNNVEQICESCKIKLQQAQSTLKTLESKFPLICYYKYNDQWKITIQKLSFLASYIEFLKNQSFLSHEDCAAVLGVGTRNDEGFHLELEDYLFGQLMLASELARLSTNAVTAGQYIWPIRIARFVAELDSGFRLLNLKNDWLRKKYDGLKYDLKKVEEVVYDLSIRGLKPDEAD